MSNVTVTTTATAATLPDGIKPAMIRAVVSAFTETDAVHVKRTKAIGALVNAGLSVRGVTALVTAALNGATPTGFSKTSVNRYALVNAAITREDLAAHAGSSDAVQAIVAGLYRLTGNGGGATLVTAAANEAAAAPTSIEAIEAIQAHVAAFNADIVKSVTATPKRQPAIGAQGADTDTDTVEPTAQSGSDDTGIRVTNALAGAGTLALISELTRRVGGRAFTADAVLSEAFDQLAAAWEERVSTEAALDEIDA